MPDVENRSLLSTTLQLMRSSGYTTSEISKRTGLPFFWLRKVRTGVIKDPSVNRVQVLYEFLNDKPLAL